MDFFNLGGKEKKQVKETSNVEVRGEAIFLDYKSDFKYGKKVDMKLVNYERATKEANVNIIDSRKKKPKKKNKKIF